MGDNGSLYKRHIHELSAAEARAALIQALLDIDKHWELEHPEDDPASQGIAPDEYLIDLLARVRNQEP